MNKLRTIAAATGLSASLIAGGCGESEISVEGHAVGFSQGIETEFTATRPVEHQNETYLPFNAYHVRTHREFDGCKEVTDGPFDISIDDTECFWSTCLSDETSHCEAEYRTEYDYTLDEEVTVLECPTVFPRREFKAPPSRNTGCEARAPKDAVANRTTRYFLWITATKPADPDDPDSKPKQITGRQEVDRDLWDKVDRTTTLSVSIYQDSIVSVDTAPTEQ